MTPLKKNVTELFSRTWVRVFILLLLLLFVVFMRRYYGAFNISLRYLYMIIITIASFWFGLKGGLVFATLSIGIFFSETAMFHEYDYRNLVMKGSVIRVAAYYACGIIMGVLSDRNRTYREKLNELAYYDELTGCLNFRFIMELFKRELVQCERSGSGLIVAMIDLDNFKSINDRYGHSTGNIVLQWFAEVLKKNVRSIDIVGRYGGDEFLLIFPDCSEAQIRAIHERIKTGLAEDDVPETPARELIFRTLQFSAGVVAYPDSGQNVEELIDAADRVLYRAKDTGKNTVLVDSSVKPAKRVSKKNVLIN